MDDTNNIANYTDFMPWKLPSFPEGFAKDNWWFTPAPEIVYIIADIHERTHDGTERILREFLTPQIDNWFEAPVLPPNGYGGNETTMTAVLCSLYCRRYAIIYKEIRIWHLQ